MHEQYTGSPPSGWVMNRSEHAGSIYRQGLPHIDTTPFAASETPLLAHIFYTNPDSKWVKGV